jgi:hypothetical protein
MKSINSLYKPSELVEAQHILNKIGKYPNTVQLTFDDASAILIALHKEGWRLVKC